MPDRAPSVIPLNRPEILEEDVELVTETLRRGVLSFGARLAEFEQLCEAMRLHSDGHTVSNPAIIACWDADRLDLYRVGIRPLPHRMCTPHARHPATIQAAMRMSEQRRRAKAGR